MNRTTLSLAALATALLLTPAAPLAAADGHVMVPADSVTFQPGPGTLPAGAQVAVLFGSPAQDGPFVIRLKFPAGYEVPPHMHSKEEHLTVISGAFNMKTGAAHDRADPMPLAPGSFVRIPAGTPHFAWTDEETVVQINGIGPFDVNYVNPGDDPRMN